MHTNQYRNSLVNKCIILYSIVIRLYTAVVFVTTSFWTGIATTSGHSKPNLNKYYNYAIEIHRWEDYQNRCILLNKLTRNLERTYMYLLELLAVWRIQNTFTVFTVFNDNLIFLHLQVYRFLKIISCTNSFVSKILWQQTLHNWIFSCGSPIWKWIKKQK